MSYQSTIDKLQSEKAVLAEQVRERNSEISMWRVKVDTLERLTKLTDAMTKAKEIQAFVHREIESKVLAKSAGYSDTQIEVMIRDAKKDMKAWKNLDVDDILNEGNDESTTE